VEEAAVTEPVAVAVTEAVAVAGVAAAEGAADKQTID
jgi:hypothetical protein